MAASSEAFAMPTLARSQYRPEIDGLRAFAVVAVIINHFNKDLLPSGYLGVDIFFVISGYVITSSLAGRESRNFLDFLAGFYERRIKRLVPALVVFVLITSVLICLFNPDPGVALGLGWRSLFGISNITLYRSSTDYFAQSTELNPFTHTWSLGVEEQFYLLFPFLIWFSGFGRQTATGARNLFFWVGALTIASLIGFIYLYQVNQPAAYFLMPPRFWEMAAGCLIFIGFQKRARIEQALEQVPPLLVVAAMVGVMFLPVSAAVPATLGIVLLSAVLIACLKQGTAAYKFFTLEKVVYVGLISYSLYLWHWSVLAISRWTIGIHWWSVPFQVSLIVAMGMASYSFIEKPLRRSRYLIKKVQVLLAGAVVLGVTVLTVSGIEEFLKSRIFVGSIKNAPEAASKNLYEFRRVCGTSSTSNHLPDENVLKMCWVSGDVSHSSILKAKTRIFTYGNSYNEQLLPLYLRIGGKWPHLPIHSYFASGCPASLLLVSEQNKHCNSVFSSYLAWFEKYSRAGDVLIVATSLGHFSSPIQPENKLLFANEIVDSKRALSIYRSELSALSRKLQSGGKKLYVVSGIPILRTEPIICYQWFSSLNDKCQRPIDQKVSAEVLRTGAELKTLERDGIELINIYAEVLGALTRGERFAFDLYRDYGHLSEKGAMQLLKVFEKSLQRLS